MVLDKKGIMLKFLVTVILALIIFIPACIGISKIFRLSSQASSSFTDFAKDIKDLAEHGQEGEKRSAILILDKETFVANLWSGLNLEEYVYCPPLETISSENYRIVEEHWRGFGSSCHGNDCLCLIREYEEKTDAPDYGELGSSCDSSRVIQVFVPTQIRCVEFPEQYYVYGIDWGQWGRFGEENTQRRQTFQLTKQGNVIYVCRDNCEIPSNPQSHPSKPSRASSSPLVS